MPTAFARQQGHRCGQVAAGTVAADHQPCRVDVQLRGLGAVGDLQGFEDFAHMVLHRAFADAQHLANFYVCKTFHCMHIKNRLIAGG